MARITQQASVLPSVPISGGGTQSNEFNAAIKSVTSATTVGAVFLYDTSQDSDPSWRKRCKGLSWFDEASSATRSARSEFPAMALIVADSESGSETLSIYDLDDPAMPLWMQFLDEGALTWSSASARTLNAVTALNGRIYLGWQDGLIDFNFVADDIRLGFTPAYQLTSGRTIAERNVTSSYSTGDGYVIVNNAVNDVAATVLEGAEIGALGLPIPTVAVATNGGVSVIHPSGDVYNDTYQIASSKEAGTVGFNSTGGFYYGSRGTAGQYHYFINRRNMIYADTSLITGSDLYRTAASGFGTPNLSLLGGSSTAMITSEASTKDSFAIGQTGGLSLVKYNTGNPGEGAVCDITSAYNTGYMVGDIRFAGLANTLINDNCVKGNHLTSTEASAGNLTATAVATSAELMAYSGFSANDYLSKAHDADFDFADGKFSVMCWAKVVTVGAYQSIAQRYDSGGTGKGWQLYLDQTTKGAYMNVHGASSTNTGLSPALSDGWHFICGVSDGSKIKIYTDGTLGNETTLAAGDLTNASASLDIGIGWDLATYAFGGSLSLLRISATVPTPKQIADIYAAEKPLFSAGANCLLQSDGAGNNVYSLSFDKTTDLLTAGHYGASGGVANAGATMFRGLEAVDSFHGQTHNSSWTGNSIANLSTAGGVSVYSRTLGGATGGGIILDLPSLDVRAELNEGESKIPDDGKLHFEGVTTDATPTVIAFVPIEQNEDYMVRVAVNGKRYQVHESSYYIDGRIEERFYIRLGGTDVETNGETMKLVNEGQAALDVDLTVSTGGSDSPASIAASAGYIMLRVTGAAAIRMQWAASVEVQRISEKTYER